MAFSVKEFVRVTCLLRSHGLFTPRTYVSRGKPLAMSSLHFVLQTFFVHQEPMGSWDVQNSYVHDAIVPNLLNSECETEMNQGQSLKVVGARSNVYANFP